MPPFATTEYVLAGRWGFPTPGQTAMQSMLGKAIAGARASEAGFRATAAMRLGTAMRAVPASGLALAVPSGLEGLQAVLLMHYGFGTVVGPLVVKGTGPQGLAGSRNPKESKAKPSQRSKPKGSKSPPSSAPKAKPEAETKPPPSCREEPQQDLEELATPRAKKSQVSKALCVRRKDR